MHSNQSLSKKCFPTGVVCNFCLFSVLRGDDIRSEHCVIKYVNDEVTLHVRPDAVATVNDQRVNRPVRLIQGQ